MATTRITAKPGLTTNAGHLITHMAHDNCDDCETEARSAATTMTVSGSTGATHRTQLSNGTVHGARVVRDQTYFGEQEFH